MQIIVTAAVNGQGYPVREFAEEARMPAELSSKKALQEFLEYALLKKSVLAPELSAAQSRKSRLLKMDTPSSICLIEELTKVSDEETIRYLLDPEDLKADAKEQESARFLRVITTPVESAEERGRLRTAIGTRFPL